MGIRDTIRTMRESGGPPADAGLTVTEAAVEEIRRRLGAYEGGDELAFFVVTQPSRLGFNVGVGFEPTSSDRPLRPEYPVPVQVSDEDMERLQGYTIDVRENQFVSMANVTVHVAETPNPDTLKFMVNRDLMTEGTASFAPPASDEHPILVRYLLEIPTVKSLFFMNNFCSVTREPGADWEELRNEVGKRLQAYFVHGGAPLEPVSRDLSQVSDVERKIIEILEQVIRPAVAQHGGDIAFAGFDDGIVQLYLMGSCMGCPSSVATLKMGVENLLKEQVPEVREVVSIG